MNGFHDRVAIVTGGTRGVGREIVLDLVRRGTRVAFSYQRSDDLARTLERETASLGEPALGIRADVRDYAAATTLVATTRDRLGGLDFVVNNAGITQNKLLMATSPEDWRQVLGVDLDGVFNVSRAAITGMMKAKHGAIVNVGSISGVMGRAGRCAYSAAKAGLIGFTKALAREVARLGVRVNALALGFTETEMVSGLPGKIRDEALAAIPLGRFGTPAEAAAAVAYLLSDEATYVTGHVLHVDGGLGA